MKAYNYEVRDLNNKPFLSSGEFTDMKAAMDNILIDLSRAEKGTKAYMYEVNYDVATVEDITRKMIGRTKKVEDAYQGRCITVSV